jgi:hypothetical protein
MTENNKGLEIDMAGAQYVVVDIADKEIAKNANIATTTKELPISMDIPRQR